LPTTRHRCNLDVWGRAAELGPAHLLTPERVLREYYEKLIFDLKYC